MLKRTAGTAALLALGAAPWPAMAAAGKKQLPVGLQLYSVRKQCEKDLPGVLQAVGKMGYQGVEFAGYYKRPAAELRKLLDDNGLKCCGTHIPLKTLLGDELKKTVEFNQTLGNPNLIVPSLPHPNMASVKALIETAKLLTDLAAKVEADGMRVGYHSHGPDFKPVEGQLPWEVLFDHAGPAVISQLDIGNCLGGGGDPIKELKRYPGRAVTIHVKEFGGKPGAVFGEGVVKWPEVFQICESTGGTQWYIIEHESDPKAPLESVQRCLFNFRKMR
jgi:sugar phosphate isomerase/epimerase